jgi:hypothetical protein
MTIIRNIPILLGALCCLAAMQLIAADESCPALRGKSTADHLEYLRGGRSKLDATCIVSAIRCLDVEKYARASTVLMQYLDYQDPASKGQVVSESRLCRI